MDGTQVAAILDDAVQGYPKNPFHPPEVFPEFSHSSLVPQICNPNNQVYRAVRKALIELKLDAEYIGTPQWSPFRALIKPGDRVVIKPNLVFDWHPLGTTGFEALITHASIIRVIIDYILLAVGTACRITICDVPLQTADWQNLVQQGGYDTLVKFYADAGIRVDLMDLRYEISRKNSAGVVVSRKKRIRDPEGYTIVDLGIRSYLYEIRHHSRKLEITDYGRYTVSKHHHDSINEYYIAGTILKSDVFINVPKLKTHRKGGVSLSLKNLVGINGDKSWIAHHRRGIDESPKFHLQSYLTWYLSYYSKNYAPRWFTTWLYTFYQTVILRRKTIKEHGMVHGGTTMEGNWYGNDTVWRTILDLNNILFFCNHEGMLHSTQQRKYLTIIDGIIGMEKEGPLDGLPKLSKLIVAGCHPVAVDYVTSTLMGFDPTRIPAIREGFCERFFDLTPFTPEQVSLVGNSNPDTSNLAFEPTKGWKGHIERLV